MPGMRGITEGTENCRLLIGKKPRFDLTTQGKIRVKFDGAFGINEPENLKYATWRHCIAYGDKAENLRTAIVGSLVRVYGFIETEGKRDEFGKLIIENGQIVKVETLICLNTELLQKDKVKSNEEQMRFEDNQGIEVGQTNSI
jgi:hypothetical protein